MKNLKHLIYIEIGLVILGFALLIISYLRFNIFTVIIGIILIVVSVMMYLVTKSIELFQKDKILDIELLKKQGFTIVLCNKCNKNNVLEDRYCIFCGEDLNNGN